MSISTFMGVETALRGLLASQRALDTTSHNIANANTEGYTRQKADLNPTDPFSTVQGAIGTGVDVTAYQRARDAFVDIQLRAQTMLQGYHDARQDSLKQVELTLNEPSDSGVSSLFNKFWSSWQDVASSPENTAVRQSLLQNAGSLASGLKNLHSQLSTAGAQVANNLSLSITDLNSAVGDIGAIDKQLMQLTNAGVAPSNDLLDRRDALLDKVAGLVNLSVTNETDGSVTLKVGDHTLLSGGVASPIATVADFGNNAVTSLPNLTYGKLAGLNSLTATLTGSGGYVDKVDTIAKNLMTAVDTLHAAGYKLDGTVSGARFFTGTDATNIDVDPALLADPKLLAAANAPSEAGNGATALAIAQLRGNATVDGAYSDLVVTIASQSQAAQRDSANAQVLTDALKNRRESVTGVSLDEEMANLLKFQRGFQASSRALTAMDDMIDYIVNRTGKVGL